MAISMLKIRRPLGRLIFNMGIAIPGKTVFLIETAPWGHRYITLRWMASSGWTKKGKGSEHNSTNGIATNTLTDFYIHHPLCKFLSWSRHSMGTFSASLTLCEGNPLVTNGRLHKWPTMWPFDVSLNLAPTNSWTNTWVVDDLRRRNGHGTSFYEKKSDLLACKYTHCRPTKCSNPNLH